MWRRPLRWRWTRRWTWRPPLAGRLRDSPPQAPTDPLVSALAEALADARLLTQVCRPMSATALVSESNSVVALVLYAA